MVSVFSSAVEAAVDNVVERLMRMDAAALDSGAARSLALGLACEAAPAFRLVGFEFEFGKFNDDQLIEAFDRAQDRAAGAACEADVQILDHAYDCAVKAGNPSVTRKATWAVYRGACAAAGDAVATFWGVEDMLGQVAYDALTAGVLSDGAHNILNKAMDTLVSGVQVVARMTAFGAVREDMEEAARAAVEAGSVDSDAIQAAAAVKAAPAVREALEPILERLVALMGGAARRLV